MKRLAIVACVPLLILAACNKNKPGTQPSSTPNARPSSTAMVTIISPTQGEVVPLSGVTVKIQLTGAHIVPAGTRALRPDEGHVHLRVDGMTITLFGGLSVSTGKLSAGPHLIEVEFAASDHGPFNPRVIERVTVTAR